MNGHLPAQVPAWVLDMLLKMGLWTFEQTLRTAATLSSAEAFDAETDVAKIVDEQDDKINRQTDAYAGVGVSSYAHALLGTPTFLGKVTPAPSCELQALGFSRCLHLYAGCAQAQGFRTSPLLVFV